MLQVTAKPVLRSGLWTSLWMDVSVDQWHKASNQEGFLEEVVGWQGLCRAV